eukprot:Phypoly_transcript_02992.p1 GENE.Phypoly_transcript_02992~~Phypoly_transcript_02992.p1  ORF type:complete len:821 (+),score=244.04 Phypoly_transcript_02992:128-2590(+)
MAIVGKNKTKATGYFEGCRFLVELGIISQSKKKEIISSIEINGGVLDFVVSKKTTHVITNEASASSYKLKSAHTHGCFIVSEEFLDACIKAGKRVDEWPYLFLGETRASELGNYKDADAVVGTQVSRAYAQVSSVMDVAYPSRVNEALSEGALNIAALCAGLGAHVPNGKFPLKSIVNNLYFTVLFNKARKPPSYEPQVVQPQVAHRPSLPPAKSTIPTPLYREISPSPRSSPSFSSSSYSRPSFPVLSSLSSTSSSSSSSSSSFKSPVKPSVQSSLFKPSTQSSLIKPSTSVPPSTSSYFNFSSSSSSSSSSRPYFSFSTSSRTSASPAAPTPSTAAPTSSTTSAPKTASYSYAQFEAERRKKREEEKAQREDEQGGVLREREARRKEEEEARKKAMEDKRLELLERRKQEDEERKQKNREITEAREKRIAEERKKREQALERLKQKVPHELLTTSFFQQWDNEENNKKIQEEWAQYEKQMEEAQRKEQEKERAARERADQLFAEKERKAQEREEQAKLAAVERAALKVQRREEYERNKVVEAERKQQEFLERQAKLLAEFMKRQERRAKKQLLKEQPIIEKNYDEQKIFVGGIKVDDIKAAKFKPELAKRVLDERINSILRMFDQFGPVHKRKVFAEKGHCFITFENKESVANAVEVMKDSETRKKLAEEAKASQQEHHMNPLCAPHPQFYVRVPNQKNKKKDKKSRQKPDDSASTTSTDSDPTPFTEVKAKPQPPQAVTPSPPSPPAPLSPTEGARGFGAADVAPDAEGESPIIRKRPVFVKKPPKPMPIAPPEIDLTDLDSFPTTKNLFELLEDEE